MRDEQKITNIISQLKDKDIKLIEEDNFNTFLDLLYDNKFFFTNTSYNNFKNILYTYNININSDFNIQEHLPFEFLVHSEEQLKEAILSNIKQNSDTENIFKKDWPTFF